MAWGPTGYHTRPPSGNQATGGLPWAVTPLLKFATSPIRDLCLDLLWCGLWCGTFCCGLAAGSAAGEEDEASIEGRWLSSLRQVTSDFVKAGEGYFSPDGQTIVFQAVPQGYPFYQIFTQPLDGTAPPRRLSTGRGRTTCAYFHPEGRQVIFASGHLDPQLAATEGAARREADEDRRHGRRRRYQWVFDPHMEIFRSDLAGGDLVRLTDSPGYDAECAFSPDGRQIVFCSDRDGDPDLYIMQADGSGVRQLTNQPGYDGGPFFSPDGNWIVFRTDRQRKDHLQIHVIRADGQHEVALTDNLGVNWAPYWHPRQPYIIWCGADHTDPRARPNYDLWLMQYHLQDGQLVKGPVWRITDHPAADVLPVFSPDGSQLMWTSNRTADGTSQLWIADFVLPAS